MFGEFVVFIYIGLTHSLTFLTITQIGFGTHVETLNLRHFLIIGGKPIDGGVEVPKHPLHIAILWRIYE
jgi:hypothetical protein